MTVVHHAILGLFFFTLGACIGSFLNVCIYRVPRRLSLVRPRSRCPKCLTEISPRDNLPIVGWLLLRGRCRRCDLPISARYPTVEALVGSLFLLCYLADAALAVNDLLDRGAMLVFAKLLLEDLVIAVFVTAAFIANDARKHNGCSAVARKGLGDEGGARSGA
jgi:leader peptidase (prepilin peptidase)/N-methyltransferase